MQQRTPFLRCVRKTFSYGQNITAAAAKYESRYGKISMPQRQDFCNIATGFLQYCDRIFAML